ncbi:MAG: hypothetical protein M3376_03010 [Actinomycetota bacterium]|nr:hypothetical protein [Actinomycetota bacterium]
MVPNADVGRLRLQPRLLRFDWADVAEQTAGVYATLAKASSAAPGVARRPA